MTGNQESRIKNHGRAAAWLIWIGALFLLCVPPLDEMYNQSRDWPPMGAWIKSMGPGAGISGTDFPAPGLPLITWSAVFVLAVVLPSVLAVVWKPAPLSQRLTLIWFVPIFVFACLASYRSVSISHRILQPWVSLPPAAGAGLLALAAAALPAFRIQGASLARQNSLSRALLIWSAAWLILLDWNGWRLPAWHPAGWAGILGAAMMLLGELLFRPVIRDS